MYMYIIIYRLFLSGYVLCVMLCFQLASRFCLFVSFVCVFFFSMLFLMFFVVLCVLSCDMCSGWESSLWLISVCMRVRMCFRTILVPRTFFFFWCYILIHFNILFGIGMDQNGKLYSKSILTIRKFTISFYEHHFCLGEFSCCRFSFMSFIFLCVARNSQPHAMGQMP